MLSPYFRLTSAGSVYVCVCGLPSACLCLFIYSEKWKSFSSWKLFHFTVLPSALDQIIIRSSWCCCYSTIYRSLSFPLFVVLSSALVFGLLNHVCPSTVQLCWLEQCYKCIVVGISYTVLWLIASLRFLLAVIVVVLGCLSHRLCRVLASLVMLVEG